MTGILNAWDPKWRGSQMAGILNGWNLNGWDPKWLEPKWLEPKWLGS